MNIFEFLELPKEHRKLDNKVTQLVKHWDEVVEKHKTGKEFATQIKRDGVCSLTVIKDGKVAIFSRTGKQFSSVGSLISRVDSLRMLDGVYMGEIWLDKSLCSLEKLSGIVNPNRVNLLDSDSELLSQKLKLSFFDLVSIESFKKGTSSDSFDKRHSKLVCRKECSLSNPNIDVLTCTYARGEDAIDSILIKAVAYGEEGIVIRDPQAGWEAGHKGWRVMKMVCRVDYDLRCIGWEEGTGKYKGKVANLIFEWKGGKTIKAMLGKGWTHNMAKEMFDSTKLGSLEEDPIGKIFQVYALEESSKGKLRLPKVGEQRFDKEEADV
jgi:ATP-dependent DNA ligase